jgi:hypothetical protein
MQTTHEKSKINPDTLTPSEFNILYRNTIKTYISATWALADLLAIGKNKFGRKTLMELVNLPITKVKWLISIAGVPIRNQKMLPEIHFELVGEKKCKEWLDRAEAENLDPLKLRSLIRKNSSRKQKNMPILKTTSYPKYMDCISRELKSMPEHEKKKAVEYITNQLKNTSPVLQ